MITAIVIAGRTGSSYTARIGTMRVTQEVDALRALALPPIEMLVIPHPRAHHHPAALDRAGQRRRAVRRAFGLARDTFGLDLSVAFDRLEQMKNTHLWVGLIKAPVFAAVIALIGCHEGMKVAAAPPRWDRPPPPAWCRPSSG